MPEGKNLEWTFAYDATVDVLINLKKNRIYMILSIIQ